MRKKEIRMKHFFEMVQTLQKAFQFRIKIQSLHHHLKEWTTLPLPPL